VFDDDRKASAMKQKCCSTCRDELRILDFGNSLFSIKDRLVNQARPEGRRLRYSNASHLRYWPIGFVLSAKAILPSLVPTSGLPVYF
jgi:hypothetical protein